MPTRVAHHAAGGGAAVSSASPAAARVESVAGQAFAPSPRGIAGHLPGRVPRGRGCRPALGGLGGLTAGRSDREPGSADAVPGQVSRTAVLDVPVDGPAAQGQLQRPVAAGDGTQPGRRDALESDRAALRDEHGGPSHRAGVDARARRRIGGVAVEPVQSPLAFVEHSGPDLAGVVRGERHRGRIRVGRRGAAGGAGRVARHCEPR